MSEEVQHMILLDIIEDEGLTCCKLANVINICKLPNSILSAVSMCLKILMLCQYIHISLGAQDHVPCRWIPHQEMFLNISS